MKLLTLALALIGASNAATTVQIFTDAFFKGSSTSFMVSAGGCANVPVGFNDNISSARTSGPRCAWYKDGGCTGANYVFALDDNLADGSGEYNDVISSVKC